MKGPFLVRSNGREHIFSSLEQVRESLEKGICFPGNHVFCRELGKWIVLSELEGISSFFSTAPKTSKEEPEFSVFHCYGKRGFQEGPVPVSKLKQLLMSEMICPSTWILPAGETQWKQVKNFTELSSSIAPAPVGIPRMSGSGFIRSTSTSISNTVNSKNKLGAISSEPKGEVVLDIQYEGALCELQDAEDSEEAAEKDLVEEKKSNINLESKDSSKENVWYLDKFEIPLDAIWYIRDSKEEQNKSHGPYSFLEVISMLEKGTFSKDDKISKNTNKGFVKIREQLEFKSKYMEKEVFDSDEKIKKKKIFISRKHVRINYMTEAVIDIDNDRYFVCNTLDISEGGVLLECKNKKNRPNIDDKLFLSILPGFIKKKISTEAVVVKLCEYNEARFSVGFVNMDDESKELIKDLIIRILQQKVS